MIHRVPPSIRHACLLIGALALSRPDAASAQDRAVRIRDADVLLTVNADGSLDVTERLKIGFVGRWPKISRGLYRHTAAGGRGKELEYSRLTATDGGGQLLRWEAYTGGQKRGRERIYLSVWITPWPMDEDRDLILRYHVTNAVSFDELNWKVDPGYPMDKAHVVVALPSGVVPVRAAVYTRLSGFNPAAKVVTDAKIEIKDNTVDISLPRAIARPEIMTVVVGLPPGEIGVPVAATQQSTGAPQQGGITMIQWWPLLFPLMVFVFAFKTWQKREEPNEESYDVRYEPTEEMSPAELGTLVDDSMDGADLTATLVDLAGRGFLRIEEVSGKGLAGGVGSTDHIIYLVRRRTEWTRLKAHEVLFLSALSDAAGTSRLIRNSWLRKTMVWPEGIRDAVYDSLVSNGYYSVRPDKVRALWTGAAVCIALAGIPIAWLAFRYSSAMISPVMVIIAAVLSAAIPYAFARIMPARTAAGARARDNALGLKDFLGRVTDPGNTSTMNSPEKFQRYLPYAIALGVAGNWAKAFDDLYGGPPDWYVGGTEQFSASSFSRSISGIASAPRSKRPLRPRARR